MKAIVYAKAGVPIDDPTSLYDAELPVPTPGPRDLLVRIDAIAVNPVDSKLRLGVQPSGRAFSAGTRRERSRRSAATSAVRAGRQGLVCGRHHAARQLREYGVVDERIASRRPMTLGAADAAALPLTAITAWELLFDRLKIAERGGAGQSVLVIGAGGGVGSILVQLARRLTALTVIGTASRQATQAWVAGSAHTT